MPEWRLEQASGGTVTNCRICAIQGLQRDLIVALRELFAARIHRCERASCPGWWIDKSGATCCEICAQLNGFRCPADHVIQMLPEARREASRIYGDADDQPDGLSPDELDD
jgi:hypothetical protein